MENKVERGTKSNFHIRFPRLWYEVIDVMGIASSMVVTQVLVMSTTMIVLFYAGRLGTAELAGVGLALSLNSISAFAMSAGLATACETFLSQSYGGSNRKLFGVFFQRGIIFFLLGYVLMAMVNINSDVFFRLLGQDCVVACIARRYLLVFTPGLAGLYLYRLLSTYLRVQDVFWTVILSTGVGTLILIAAGYVSTYVLHGGVDGIALSASICFVFMAAVQLVYIYASGIYLDTWPGRTLQLFRDWGQFAKLACAGTVLVISEYCFIEVVTILAGTMGGVQLAAQAIVFQIDLIGDMVHFGSSIAVAIRVGTSLGANDPDKAVRTIVLVLFLGFLASGLAALFISSMRHPLMRLFTSDPEIHTLGAKLLPVAAVSLVIEAGYTMLNGTLRGCGRQGTASILNVLFMYGIGVPLLIGLRYTTSIDLLDCWWIFAGTLGLLDITFLALILKTDWRQQALLAQKIIGKRERSVSNTDTDKLMLEEKETAPLLTAKPVIEDLQFDQRRSAECIIGALSRNQSTFSLHMPPWDDDESTSMVVRSRLTLLIGVICVCVLLSGINIAGLTSAEALFGINKSYLNDTMVESCRHLL